MTLPEALAQGPRWLSIWLNVLTAGAFFLPLTLLIWRQTRLVALFAVITGVLAAISVGWMYDRMGWVKLLGLPHVILWTPLAIYLLLQIRRPDVPVWPRRIMVVVLAVIVISLAFDYTDVVRYLLGNRTPLAMPAN